MQSRSNNYPANLKLAEINLLYKNEKKRKNKLSKRIQLNKTNLSRARRKSGQRRIN